MILRQVEGDIFSSDIGGRRRFKGLKRGGLCHDNDNDNDSLRYDDER